MPNIFCTVKELRSKVIKARRAGIIPYTKTKKGLLFWLGVDPSKDLTDFGGQSKVSDKDFLSTATREFEEESLGVFGEIDLENLYNSLCVYDGKMVIIFYQLKYEPCFLHTNFEKLVKQEKRVEVENLFCVNEGKMTNLIKRAPSKQRLYDRIRKSLSFFQPNDLFESIRFSQKIESENHLFNI